MRTNEPTESTPWKPLGERVVKPQPEKPEPKETGPSGLVTGEDGRMRTTRHPLPGND
jgi:hypothetical protein